MTDPKPLQFPNWRICCVLFCCWILITNLKHLSLCKRILMSRNSHWLLHRVEPVYATFPRLSPDGYWTRLPSFRHGGGPYLAVAAGREEEQEGWFGEHFQQRESVAAPETVQSSGGSGCRAEGPGCLGPRRWGWTGPGLDRTEGPKSQERAEDQREGCTGLTLATSIQSPQVEKLLTWCDRTYIRNINQNDFNHLVSNKTLYVIQDRGELAKYPGEGPWGGERFRGRRTYKSRANPTHLLRDNRKGYRGHSGTNWEPGACRNFWETS